MNRRQKKKQFKKVHGMNPKQYEKWLQEHWLEIYAEAAKIACEGIKMGCVQFRAAAFEMAKEIRNRMDKWAETILEVAGAIKTYNLQEGGKQDEGNGTDS